MIALGFTLLHLVVRDFTWFNVISRGFNCHLVSLGFTWFPPFHLVIWSHLVSLEFTLFHLVSLAVIWFRSVSFGLTWSHLNSLGLTYISQGNRGMENLIGEEGQRKMAQTPIPGLDLIRQPDRAHAHTTRNDFRLVSLSLTSDRGHRTGNRELRNNCESLEPHDI
jgi:hypothetical protein